MNLDARLSKLEKQIVNKSTDKKDYYQAVITYELWQTLSKDAQSQLKNVLILASYTSILDWAIAKYRGRESGLDENAIIVRVHK